MWWKLPLLLLMTAPLAYRAWREVDAPPAKPPSIDLPSREELSRKKTAVNELQQSREDHAVNDAVSAAVFRIDAKERIKEPSQVDPPPLTGPVNGHGIVVQEVRDFARIYLELESDPARAASVPDREMKRWLEERRDDVKTRKTREKSLFAEMDTLNGKVRNVLRGRNGPALTQARQTVERTLDDLQKHREQCKNFPILLAWADRQHAEWTLRRDLLAVVRDDAGVEKTAKREDVIRHLGRYSQLFQSAGSDRESQTLVRTEAKRFCELYLPREMEITDLVRYRKIEVPRENIVIYWKAGRSEEKQYGNPVQLIKTKYTEFNPPDMAAVAYYRRPVGKGDDDCYEQLQPTPANRAAHHFNEHRKTLTWTETAMGELIDECPVKWSSAEATPAEYRRAEHLRDAMHEHSVLFGQGD
jgi:hypothetical protein